MKYDYLDSCYVDPRGHGLTLLLMGYYYPVVVLYGIPLILIWLLLRPRGVIFVFAMYGLAYFWQYLVWHGYIGTLASYVFDPGFMLRLAENHNPIGYYILVVLFTTLGVIAVKDDDKPFFKHEFKIALLLNFLLAYGLYYIYRLDVPLF